MRIPLPRPLLLSRGCFPWRFAALVALLALPASAATDWPGFRGPWGDGQASAPGDTRPAGLPLAWSETENVVWKTAIPERGWSTPAVMAGKVWLTTAALDGTTFHVLSVDAATGRILQQEKLFDCAAPEPLGNKVNGYATPSPALEPGRVYVHFGSYGTACLDTATGRTLWQRQDLPCRHYRGPASSPVLFENLVILSMDGADVQYLVALDKLTGRTVWKTDRSVEWNDSGSTIKMVQEGDRRKAHSTPLLVTIDGQPRMLSAGAKAAYAYDPRTGKELWRVRYEAWSAAPLPVYRQGLVFFITGLGKTELLAVRTDGSGDVTDTHVVWRTDSAVAKTASPVLVDDLFYMVADNGIVTCLETTTGKQVWRERLPGNYAASPIHADGLLYFCNQEGKTTLVKPGRTWEVVGTNTLDVGLMASPAVAGKALFLRTKTHLYRVETSRSVTYEEFGAVGDGVADDLPAIVKAHAFANTHGLPVKTRPEATYHLGRRALTATITTATDWGTSRFVIDDRDVENHRASLFVVRSLLEPVSLPIQRLTRDQRQLDVRPPRDCWVRVESNRKRVYIRRGLNQNNGTPQRDCFILRRDGTIEGAIDWDYETITRVEARPLDERPLVIKGGVFTTTANRMKQEKGYNYWSRNIAINRSNTTVEGLTHRIVGETDVGHPYGGFIEVSRCANVTLRDCTVTGHKTYTTIGSAGKPVSMGTYDLSANEVVNFTMIGCRMDNLCDPTRWGVIGTNFCKNILLENCTLSRMDTHQGVSGTYTIRGCTLGHAGLNAIGRGTLTVENSTLNGRSLIGLRSDYGSTWEGTVIIRHSRWIPACGAAVQPYLISANNDGQHDFGYPCFMPREVIIDGLIIEDRPPPKGYPGPYLFTDPDGKDAGTAVRPFPYRLTEQVTIRNLTTASGRKLQISPDPGFNARVRVVEAN